MNRLYYGDNLKILRNDIADESVDLVYLDPPFNSNRSYNILFKSKSGDEAQAQLEAFDDTWTWSHESDWQYGELIAGGAPAKVADALIALRKLLGDNDLLAYLVMMTARLVELHRVLKPTGSAYLHCDPAASHYLKVVMDAIFGPERFRTEIVWKRTSAHSDGKQGRAEYGRIHDVILYYSKGESWTWNSLHTPHGEEYVKSKYPYVEEGTGRRFGTWDMTGPGGAAKGNPSYEVMGVTRYWRYSQERMNDLISQGRVVQTKPGKVPRQKRYLDESDGVPLQDLWIDISPLNSQAAERLGYPTQKPVALLDRILQASSNPGDVVLDPFCGCGTTIDAAQKLGRRWVGIDITFLSIDLIRKRLLNTYGEDIVGTYELRGVPRDLESAHALFDANAFDFERWAVALVNGQPNEKQVGDKGVDGVVRFHLNEKELGEAIVSVKGGKSINPSMVRDLVGTVESRKAEMGLLVCMAKPTAMMQSAASAAGTFTSEFSGTTYPKVQIITVTELLAGKKPKMPTPIMPYKLAKRASGQMSMLD